MKLMKAKKQQKFPLLSKTNLEKKMPKALKKENIIHKVKKRKMLKIKKLQKSHLLSKTSSKMKIQKTLKKIRSKNKKRTLKTNPERLQKHQQSPKMLKKMKIKPHLSPKLSKIIYMKKRQMKKMSKTRSLQTKSQVLLKINSTKKMMNQKRKRKSTMMIQKFPNQ